MATLWRKMVYSKWSKIDLDDIFGFKVVHSIVFDHPKWILAIFYQNQSFPGSENEFFWPENGLWRLYGEKWFTQNSLKLI